MQNDIISHYLKYTPQKVVKNAKKQFKCYCNEILKKKGRVPAQIIHKKFIATNHES